MIEVVSQTMLLKLISFFLSKNPKPESCYKQAYINELKNKVSLLEEENERLRKQKVIFIFDVLI